jgi:hypothetical protein
LIVETVCGIADGDLKPTNGRVEAGKVGASA